MYFLLTRPKQDSDKLAEILTALGHQVTCEPLLEIDIKTGQKIDLNNFQAILFTSANGVRAFIRNCPDRNIPCYAVGQATANEAEQAGFAHIHTAGGDVTALTDLAMRKLDPVSGKLLHISGTDMAGNLSEFLTEAGFQITHMPLYKARKLPQLSENCKKLITSGQITHMPFYSPRTAMTFRDLIISANLQAHLTNITALCLSPAISIVIDSLNWQDILIAGQPTQRDLFNRINITFEKSVT